mmetsp:Transcript_28706/g.68500  ORF Transcript_28706/g.68500 Transcript_28706/m.68500 type:complete len:87 (-) Transcript_28706:389-649(-)
MIANIDGEGRNRWVIQLQTIKIAESFKTETLVARQNVRSIWVCWLKETQNLHKFVLVFLKYPANGLNTCLHWMTEIVIKCAKTRPP